MTLKQRFYMMLPISAIYPASRFLLLPRSWMTIVAVAFLMMCSQHTLAQQETGIDNSPYVSPLIGSALAGSSPSIDQHYTPGTEISRTIKNIVRFSFNEAYASYIPQSFSADITVNIGYGNSSYTDNTLNGVVLHVSYDTAKRNTYIPEQNFSFYNAQYVRVTVVNVNPSIATLSNGISTLNLLMLQNEMQVMSYYDLNGSPVPTFQSPSHTSDALTVYWTNTTNGGNNGVQLEWTWLETELSGNFKVGGTLDTTLLFKNNATRVDLSLNDTAYSIPLMYDGTGYLYYRIRAVSHKSNGSRMDGSWSAAQTYSFGGHNNNLNWQVATSFAEDGKLKTVIQYYDGSLRGRQTVTKDNSTNTIVTAETFYDGQGRPAVQVLPAPGTGTVIGYTSNLNLFSTQSMNEDPAKYFDLVAANNINSFTPAMTATQSAAAKYYSSSTPDSTGSNKYLPDAEGYPYSVTRYTPDATGRILSQSGVGAALKMGSRHETKYYYGSPAQEELDGLFGTEAGDNTHYFKNMVLDANGQMSVNYVDMHGRTIATALAGSAPTGITPLSLNATDYPNQAGTTYMTRNLLDTATNIVRNNNSIESVNTILVPATTLYTFTYKLNPQTLRMARCSGDSLLSYDCMYNLAFSITDESGDTPPFVFSFNNVKANADDTVSTLPARFKNDTSSAVSDTITFTQLLQPGSYVVRKTLSLSEASLESYKQAYLAKALCTTQQQLIDSVYNALLPYSDCHQSAPASPCLACQASLGTYEQYKPKYITNLGYTPDESIIHAAYSSDSAHCTELCTDKSHTLETIRLQMLADMIPYTGQYAQDPNASPAPSGTMYSAYDIFATSEYKTPANSSGAPDYYYDVNHNKDITIQPDGTRALLGTTTPQDFAGMFSYSWAESLLPYHPEYNKLRYAQQHLTASYDWIDNFSQVDTYSAAQGAGYVLSSSSFGSTPADSFFSVATGMKTAMSNIVGNAGYYNGLSLWQIAYGDLFCKTITDDGLRGACYAAAPANASTSGLSTDQQDQMWNAFKNLYRGVRDSMVLVYLDANAGVTNAGTLVSQNFTLHFATNAQTITQYGWSGSFGVNGNPPNVSMADSVKATYSGRCSSYIDQWKLKLLQCSTIASLDPTTQSSLLTEITDSLISVCNRGIDDANPYGSSTVAPSALYDGSPRSFEEAISVVLGKHSSLGIPRDLFCNPFSIESPKPYGKGPVFTKMAMTVLDSCGCARFNQLQNEAVEQATDFNSFNAYLQATYGDTLTKYLYDTLYAHCGNLKVSVSKYRDPSDPHSIYFYDSSIVLPLTQPQPMPAFLQCGFTGGRQCLTCDSIRSLTNQFKAYFSSPYDTALVLTDSLDSAALAYNALYARFLNARTGLQYTWQQYAAAAAAVSCSLTDYSNINTAPQTVICPDTHALNDTAGLFPHDSLCQKTHDQAEYLATNIYEQRKQQLLADFESQYRAACLAAQGLEKFIVQDTAKEYHYTLYYYDMAGNLVKTVPPKGVHPDFSDAFTASIKAARAAGTTLTPSHTFTTNYRYNSLNQMIAQNTPDAGTSAFWYDRLGRLAASQNARQVGDGKYSYTRYDDLGRITEVGQVPQSNAMSQTISQDTTALLNWITVTGGTREQLTCTVYDVPYTPMISHFLTQQNLRNRVSYTYTQKLVTDDSVYAASYYTYDVHGNVDTLLQDYYGVTGPGSADRFKRICYQYDLISGKVNSVDYQPGLNDAFYHKYSYDAENRIIEVYTSRDKIIWEREAAYSYYKHGPLSRTVLGQLLVQGLDYSYTLQGWFKGINPVFGSAISDSTLPYAAESYPVARDVYGFSLHYYNGDYKAIGSNNANPTVMSVLSSNAASLYNGNIAAMAVNIPKLGDPKVYNYHYDQLNRFKQMDAFNLLKSPNGTFTLTATTDYKEQVAYDPNGNITNYLRNGTAASGHLVMDSLTYSYYPNLNQLRHVRDTVNRLSYTNDIDSMKYSYTYDPVGNLKSDNNEGITDINWTVYGKIDTIAKTSGTIKYSYDAAGNRISKISNGKTTMYVRDAQGNVMSVYERTATIFKQTELHIYGSSRLGMVTDTILPQTVSVASGFEPALLLTFTRGKKVFELSNHLGNVLATITDRKIAIPSASNSSLIDHYEAAVASVQDYYPFGMLMGGRNLTSPVCKDSTEDFTTVMVTSDLSSATVSGANVTQNGVTWKPYSTGNGNIALVSQAIQVDATSTSGGVMAIFPSASVSPNTVYMVEFDITSMTSGVTSFFCQLQSASNVGQPYRVLTQKTGTGHYALLCTMPATYDFLRLRVSAVQAGTGQYFVVDNLVLRKMPLSTEALLYSTSFSTAAMSGVNINDNGQVWSPTNGTATTLSIDNTGSNRKIKVSPTTTTDSQIQTDFSIPGGKDYIARYTLAQSDSTKRIYLDLYARTSGTWNLTDSRSVIYLPSSGYDMLNFTLPSGADAVRFLFRRSTDAPTVAYTIDSFSISRLDTVGRMTVSACSVGDTTSGYRYGFNGKERDKDISRDEYDFGLRIYDPRSGRFLSLDPFTKNTPAISPYAFANNSPLNNVDYNGGFAIFWHYIITKRALLKLGISGDVAKLISHYASVFADNPRKSEGWKTGLILGFNQGRAADRGISLSESMEYIGHYRNGIDYSATVNTQSQTDRDANIQHCTRMVSEIGVVAAGERVLESTQFAWNKIFESATLGNMESFKENDKGIEYLGEGLHALEDIERHKGAVYSDDKKLNEHSLYKDVWPDDGEVENAGASVTNALRVHQILNGNFNNATIGTKIDIYGMSGEQIQRLKSAVRHGGYELQQKEEFSSEYSIQKKG